MAEMDKLMARVREMVADVMDMDVADVNPQSRLVEDLGIDSLDAVALVLSAEEEFGIDVDEAALEHFATVKDIAAYIAKAS